MMMVSALEEFSVNTESKFAHVLYCLYSVPGIAPSTWHILIHLILTIRTIPILQMKTLRHGNMKSIAQVFLKSKWQS